MIGFADCVPHQNTFFLKHQQTTKIKKINKNGAVASVGIHRDSNASAMAAPHQDGDQGGSCGMRPCLHT
jgi:hypothetical protein